MDTPLYIDGHQLTMETVAKVAYGEPGEVIVSLSPEAVVAVQKSRTVVEQVLTTGKTVYGINTGFGALSSVTIPTDQVDQLQQNLVRSHAAGTGDPLDIPTVRAMMLLRANTLAKGYSGASLQVIESLLAFLNRGVHPVIPSQGSLGASGDLAPLAHLALVLMGEGEAWWELDRLSGAQALEAAKLRPIQLHAKDGLALLNGTQMMTAIGVLTLLSAEQLMIHADLAGAMTIEAIQGSAKPFSEAVANLRPHPGHQESAALIRQFLQDSEIMASHQDCAKVQDPYSLRCIPQVHGAVRETLAAVRDTLTIEVNSVTDNPLVFPDGEIVSQGNFHGEPVAMALDRLTMALTELGSISERRLDKLMNPVFSGLPAFLTGTQQEGLHSGFMIIHYTAASLVSENKGLSYPACVDSIPTSNDKEDHVSMGAIAARQAARALKNTRWVIGAELLAASQGLEHRNGLEPGLGVQSVYQQIRSVLPPLSEDRSLSPDVAQLVQWIQEGTFLKGLEPKS